MARRPDYALPVELGDDQWKLDANCRNADPDIFFPSHGKG